jgi:CubicO group peptidase (beta-lactamase class C family)
MRLCLPVFLFALVVFLPTVTTANDGIDNFVRSEMQKKHIPGASLVVIRNGRIIKSANYGLANVELNAPVNDQTSFEIASMTKQFTAAALLLLVEDGKVRLDDSVTAYLADLPSTWQDINIRRLLDHTSGLRDDWDEGNDFFLTKNSDQAFLDALKQRPLGFRPGERFSYSCGPFVVGMIISKVSGVPYAEFMRRRIFEPPRYDKYAHQ